MIRGGISVTVHTASRARSLAKAAEKMASKVRVHLKVDTGMGRLGCAPERAPALAREIARSSWLELEGVCTHLASPGPEGRKETERQLARFRRVIDELDREGIAPTLAPRARERRHPRGASGRVQPDPPRHRRLRDPPAGRPGRLRARARVEDAGRVPARPPQGRRDRLRWDLARAGPLPDRDAARGLQRRLPLLVLEQGPRPHPRREGPRRRPRQHGLRDGRRDARRGRRGGRRGDARRGRRRARDPDRGPGGLGRHDPLRDPLRPRAPGGADLPSRVAFRTGRDRRRLVRRSDVGGGIPGSPLAPPPPRRMRGRRNPSGPRASGHRPPRRRRGRFDRGPRRRARSPPTSAGNLYGCASGSSAPS